MLSCFVQLFFMQFMLMKQYNENVIYFLATHCLNIKLKNVVSEVSETVGLKLLQPSSWLQFILTMQNAALTFTRYGITLSISIYPLISVIFFANECISK